MEEFQITTSRLIIRHLESRDLQDFHFYRSRPEVAKYQGFDPMTIEEAGEFIRENSTKRFGKAGEWVQYAIEDKKPGKVIGDCAIRLNSSDHRMAEIGISISPCRQRQGYAKEVLTGILEFLFDKHNLHRVVETVDTENLASIHLLQSIGFRQEGHFKENIFFKGKWASEYQYAMLKREWGQKTT